MRLVTIGLFGLLSLLLGVGVAAACDCAELTIEQQVDGADVVARVSVENIDRSAVLNSSADPVTYTVVAARVWKGDAPARFSFTSALDGASCGIEGIEEGQELLLFAHQGDEGLTSSLCSGTTVATEEVVAQVTAHMGEGSMPEGVAEDVTAPGLERGWGLPIAIAVLAALAAAAIYARRYLRRRRETEEFAADAVRHSDTPLEPDDAPGSEG